MLPFIGLEFVLIYLFRVVLNHYNSVKNEVLQLELRQSLCQFIQSYAKYAKELKVNDNLVLEKFENLIFSPISSRADKSPTVLDDVNQLVTLLKEVKNT